MDTAFRLLVPAAIALVAVILGLGLWTMMRGGSPGRSQSLMRARVIAQFAAVVVIMAALWIFGR